MERATGIGGIFFKVEDPEKTRNWYKEHLGFNTDESGRQVFDGMVPHIAGAARTDLNHRVTVPGAGGGSSSFPFADAAYVDPVTGLRDGTLENSRASMNQPKIFYTNRSRYERRYFL